MLCIQGNALSAEPPEIPSSHAERDSRAQITRPLVCCSTFIDARKHQTHSGNLVFQEKTIS